ncbi:hypothetical protein SUGI_0139760 [Cryptomeria japonica]|uniref:GTP-binding protein BRASSINAZOLE INSENSITIVE PALE GREEN 2, chloroplastic n=1 Tax=Cryptomeria japonica TaxID=3369 RepID=UPI002408EB3A|nr:GTP-binding protein BRASSINAZOLE INSENSITIVE PALE GREEN 2, chloroplastic [Cryptomeria japonica]GLJ10993.1 hypothetical protein SUGI_0139760 [Cryptomeria japonica]
MAVRLLDIALFPKLLSAPPNKCATTKISLCPNKNLSCPWKSSYISSHHLKNSKYLICRAAKDVKTRNPTSENISFREAAVEGIVGFSQGRDEDADCLVCPGCGVFMQDEDPEAPGFFLRPIQKDVLETPKAEEDDGGFFQEEWDSEDEHLDSVEEDFNEIVDEEDFNEIMDEEDLDEYTDVDEEEWKTELKGKGFREETLEEKVLWKDREKILKAEGEDEDDEGFGEEDDDGEIIDEEDEDEEGENMEEWSDMTTLVDEEEEWKRKLQLDAFAPAGLGYGNITEETIKEKVLKSERKKKAKAEQKKREEEEMVVVCARCHSLRYYGNVKDQKAENLLPEFDFESAMGSRLMKPRGVGRTVVVMVVDAVDFDGSFPRRAAKMLNGALHKSRGLRLVLVATKADLLPGQVSPARLHRWVRLRARAAGAPKLSGVFLVSAHRDLGLRNLIAHIKESAGPRGNVWVIGAQNAGKSTLINSIGKKERGKVTHLTEAAVPGTTLGIIRIGGILPAKAKLYDTPGLLHSYQMTMRLNREEQKMIEIRKQLKPRTYRVKVGQAVHVGGLMRLDVDQASVETIYITVWASVHVSMHLGKVETANGIKEKQFGVRLQPPIGEERVRELGEWKPNKVKVSGNTWDANSVDVAVAGVGWFSLGLKGDASLSLWTYDGVDFTVREPLVLDKAPSLERPGFLLSKTVTKAISEKSKVNSNDSSKRKKAKSNKGNTDDLAIELLEEELGNA